MIRTRRALATSSAAEEGTSATVPRSGVAAVILPGVRIGAGSLVGAGATVTRDVSDGAVAVGNPARLQGARRDLGCHAELFRAGVRLDAARDAVGRPG